MDYGDFQRKFLRKITAKGCVELQAAQRYLNEIKNGKCLLGNRKSSIGKKWYLKRLLFPDFPDNSETQLDTIIPQINNALKLFEQQLSIIRHEQFDDEEFLVFSTIAPIPALISLQKAMRPNDFKYFEAVLKALLTSDNYQMRSKLMLGLESTNKVKENERLLQMWIKLGYFVERDGIMFLGPKSLVEFKDYIRSEYPAIKTCNLCYSLTFLDIYCRSCGKYFHKPCLEKFWQSKPNACATCWKPWDMESD